jgi:hypothetical protein
MRISAPLTIILQFIHFAGNPLSFAKPKNIRYEKERDHAEREASVR